MNFYMPISAKNKGWTVEYIPENHWELVKYKKNDMYFYSTKFGTIDVNHQTPRLSIDKWITYQILKLEGISIITIQKISQEDDVKELYKQYSRDGQYSVILKPLEGFESRGVIKCDLLKEMIENKHLWEREIFCISTFYPHDIEVRFIIFKGKYQFLKLKTNSEFANAEDMNHLLTKKVIRHLKKEAEKVANVLKYDFVAVDFMVNTNESILLEINLNPNLIPYSNRSKRNFERCIELCEKMLDYKEQLLMK